PFTKRHPILEEFTPEESEDRLYELVSEYLRHENLQALPSGQRSLMTLVLRKLLASSTFAIAGALASISERLKAKIKKVEPAESLEEELDNDYEAFDETAEEWSEDEPAEPISKADRAAIEAGGRAATAREREGGIGNLRAGDRKPDREAVLAGHCPRYHARRSIAQAHPVGRILRRTLQGKGHPGGLQQDWR